MPLDETKYKDEIRNAASIDEVRAILQRLNSTHFPMQATPDSTADDADVYFALLETIRDRIGSLKKASRETKRRCSGRRR
jgi:hypothetical protein